MRKLSQLTKVLLTAVLIGMGATSAWATFDLPTPVYTENFESASTTVGDAGANFGITGATLTGSGSIGTGDPLFGQYYQAGGASSTRVNYLTLSTTAFQSIQTAGNEAATISFWLNAHGIDDTNNYGSIFVAYGESGNTNHGYPFSFDIRANLTTHSSLWGTYFDQGAGIQENNTWRTLGSTFADSWHHVAIAYSIDKTSSPYQTVMKYYIDGVLVQTRNITSYSAAEVTTDKTMFEDLSRLTEFVIGGNSPVWEDPDNGYAYDEINIYSSALTPAQVQKIIADKQGLNLVYYEDFTEDEDGGTSTDVTKYGMTAGSNGGTYAATVTDGKYTSVAGKTGSSNASGYTEHYISFDAISAGKLVTISYDWQSGGATGKAGSSRSETKLTDASGNVILKISLYGQDYQWKVNDVNFGTSGKTTLSPSSGSVHTVVATVNMSSKKIVSMTIDGTSYATDIDFYSSEATTLSRLYVSQTTGTTISWSNTATLDNIAISTQDIISATVNAKCGETILATEVFTALSGETIYYGWPKYILKDGVLYNNQQRTAGKQYTATSTETTVVNNSYSVVNLGTATAAYYNELGSGANYDNNSATWSRASHGNVTSVSSKSSTEGSCVLTVATGGTLPAGTYTFELGNYKNRGSIIKVGDIRVGTTSKGSNGATYVVTTLNNIIVPEGAAVTIINASGTSATENIDYFLAIRTGDASVSKTITAGWATYCSPYALDLSSATGLTDAYIVTGGAGGVLTTESVKDGTVRANTGLLLKGDAGAVTIPVVASSSTDVSGNKLVGVTTETAMDLDSDDDGTADINIYVLMNDATNGLGFYQTTATSFTLGANTAYLPSGFDATGARAFYSLFDSETTGVGATLVNSERVNNEIFNLQGRRVSQPTKGLYIVNGKKVVVK